jgi:hypothetical protein
MLSSLFQWRTLTALLALTCLPVVVLAAPAPEPKAKPDSPAQKVRKALDQAVDLDVTEQPLQLAINQLHEQTKINFVFDRLALQQSGIDPNQQPVNCKQQNAKVRTILRSLLSQYSLAYAIVGDNIIISTEEGALTRQLKQKVSVDLDQVPLATALKDLAQETGCNLLVDKKTAKEAQAEVTLQLEDVPLDTIVRLLCEQASLKPVRMGNVLFVTNKAKAAELRAEPDLTPGGGPVTPGVAVEDTVNAVPAGGGMGGAIFLPNGNRVIVGGPFAPPVPGQAVPAPDPTAAPPADAPAAPDKDKKPDEKKPEDKKPDDKPPPKP